MRLFIILFLLSANSLATEKIKTKKTNKDLKSKAVSKSVSKELPKEITQGKKTEDCDSKEDILKKLEEEKKKKEQAFSLQGGNTGCSLDKK